MKICQNKHYCYYVITNFTLLDMEIGMVFLSTCLQWYIKNMIDKYCSQLQLKDKVTYLLGHSIFSWDNKFKYKAKEAPPSFLSLSKLVWNNYILNLSKGRTKITPKTQGLFVVIAFIFKHYLMIPLKFTFKQVRP